MQTVMLRKSYYCIPVLLLGLLSNTAYAAGETMRTNPRAALGNELGSFPGSPAVAPVSLNLRFKNNTTLPNNQVFITFQNPNLGNNQFEVTYNGGTPVPFSAPTDMMSRSLSLKQIGSNGFEVTTMVSTVIFVSYGAPLSATTVAPSPINSSDPDYYTAFQTFELTRRTDNPTDQGNITAINYFTAPMKIESFSGGTSLQKKRYSLSAAEIGKQIGRVTKQSSLAVIKSKDGSKVIRYLGPSQYGPDLPNPYSSLLTYLKEVHAAGQQTTIRNFSSFDFTVGADMRNYKFTFDLIAAVSSTGAIAMNGPIRAVITASDGSKKYRIFKDAKVTIAPLDRNRFKFVLYGQQIDDSLVKFGPGWAALGTYLHSIGISSADADATLFTVKNQAIGEITSGVLMGMLNSSVIPSGKTIAIKDMPSNQWWKLKPVIGFSQAQPGKPSNYNRYADVIYRASNNKSYSIPYSDRLGNGPLVNSVEYKGLPVDTWEVTLQPPVSVP